MTRPPDPPPEVRLPREVLRDLERPGPVRFVAAAALRWAEIGLAYLFLAQYWSVPAYVLATWVIGTRQHGLGMLGHDGAHGAVSRDRRVNDLVVGLLAFWPIWGGLDGYRKFHFEHHRRAGEDDDPEYVYKQLHPGDWDLPTSPARLVGRFGKDLLGLSADRMLRLGVVAPPESRVDKVAPAALGALSLAALYAADALWMAGPWALGMVTGHWAVFRLRAHTEHLGTRDTHRIRAGPLARWFFLQDYTWYHWEHHRFPRVPGWRLPEVRRLLGDQGPPVIGLGELFSRHFRAPAWPDGIPPAGTPPSTPAR